MKVVVLKVNHEQGNVDELDRGIQAGRTVDGWQMPKHSGPGDIAVWYASAPRQEYIAWGWVTATPRLASGTTTACTSAQLPACAALTPCPGSRQLSPAASTGIPTLSSRRHRRYPTNWPMISSQLSASTRNS